MSEEKNEVVKLTEDLMKVRGNPLLILKLEEICRPNCFNLYEEMYGKRYNNLDIILHTPGGDISEAFNISKILRSVAKHVTIIVPLHAKSAGTLICLCADKIVLTLLSELGPLDTQIQEEREGSSPVYSSALNGFKALEQVQVHTLETLDIATKLILQRTDLKVAEAIKLAIDFSGNTSGTLYHQLDPKRIGEYARALEIGERYGITILTRFMGWSEKDAESVVKRLVKYYPNHGYIIDCDELKSLGLPAEMCDDKEEQLIHELRKELIKTKATFIKMIELKDKKENLRRVGDNEE